MTTMRRRTASWVHERRADDEPSTFTHTTCGLAFTTRQVDELPDDTPVTCPECVEAIDVRARAGLLADAPRPAPFRPKTPETAAAWAGPRVEVCTTVLGHSNVRTVVFVDGIEVPYAHLAEHVVDPTIGISRRRWDAITRDVTGDVTLSETFRELVVSERDAVAEFDGGRHITAGEAS
jgi:hypothetical protein